MQEEFSISKIRNRHELKITDEPLPTVLPKSYRNTSQVNELLHPPIQSYRNPNFHLTKSQNPITQQSVSRQVPENKFKDTFQKGRGNTITTEHETWLNLNKKFSKAYSDCTRYIDNLSQNQALIRRGPFDMPLGKNSMVHRQSTEGITCSRQNTEKGSRQYSLSNNLSRLKSASCSVNQMSQIEYKSVFRTKKDMVFKSLNNLKEDLGPDSKHKASKSINYFDRSLKNTANSYEILMRQERNHKLEAVVLKNSSNKLLAVDLIRQKLEENSLGTKNNLKKIQQKFKKRPEIRVCSENLQNL